jgi:short subunit dehydrogenase-like uncharacterized protein
VTLPVVLYGANGYTGTLIAEALHTAGESVVLAGRSVASVQALGDRLRMPWRAVSLDDAAGLDALLADARVVLHCAGPFSRTSRQMVDACLRTRTHYLDITGELQVFAACHARDAEARAAGILLMPGVGFDVVPSDCLASHTAARLPGAASLVLAFHNTARKSHGTTKSMIERAHEGGMIRRAGALVSVPPGYHVRAFDFGRGPRTTVTIPWGDVYTAHVSTGVPDVRVYAAASPGAVRSLRATRWLRPLLRLPAVQQFLIARATRGPAGPTPEERVTGRTSFICEARDAAGRTAVSRLTGPEGYTMTMHTALLMLRHVLAHPDVSGYATPSQLCGADSVLQVPGVTRTDEPITG